jgi:hypothetical protein
MTKQIVSKVIGKVGIEPGPKPLCPFWRKGARCVLASEVRAYRNCAGKACMVLDAMSMTVSLDYPKG